MLENKRRVQNGNLYYGGFSLRILAIAFTYSSKDGLGCIVKLASMKLLLSLIFDNLLNNEIIPSNGKLKNRKIPSFQKSTNRTGPTEESPFAILKELSIGK